VAIRDTKDQLFGEWTQKLEFLTTPINKIPLKIKGTLIEQCQRDFSRILRDWKISLRPTWYIGDEWGCLERTTCISIPFYELDERLKKLNKETRGWYNGKRDIMEHLMHEFGHAFNYAHRLYQLKSFREVFKVKGKYCSNNPVYETYTPNPWSKDYVNPCGAHYAQSHPDEDFAETFMVVIDPRYNFRKRLKSKPGALRKCIFVEDLIGRYCRQAPKIRKQPKTLLGEHSSLDYTVAEYFNAKISKYKKKAHGYIDPNLEELFPNRLNGSARNPIPAADFVREHRKTINRQVATWTGLKPKQIRLVIDKIISRCQILDLATRDEIRDKQLVSLTAFVTTMVLDWFHTGRFLNL
jgi:hypothetical protein